MNTTIRFQRESLNSFDTGIRKEWLLTNGIGGFASSTLIGTNTRRYHGLLVASLAPPSDRTLLLSGIDEECVYGNDPQLLSCYEFVDRTVHPHGYSLMIECSVSPTLIEWIYAWDDVLLAKRVWMGQGENTTYIQYDCIRASKKLELSLRPLCAYRNYHWHQRGEQPFQVNASGKNLSICSDESLPTFTIAASTGTCEVLPVWYWNFFHRAEAERGLDTDEDLFIPGLISATLTAGKRLTLSCSVDGDRLTAATAARTSAEKKSAQFIKGLPASAPEWIQTLAAHGQHFVIERPIAGEKKPGASIIAGFPWFTDWTRDTMISLPGLTLATGNTAIAKRILQTYAAFVSEGMLPNRFLDAADELEYNSVDGSLLFFHALYEYFQLTNDTALLKSLYPVLKEICQRYTAGTRHGIQVDPGDGLLCAGEEGIQLTWMDAKVGDWVVTPRRGKAVEVNALWYNALEVLTQAAKILDEKEDRKSYSKQAKQVKTSFKKFWNETDSYLVDVIDKEVDPSFRPNQLFAVALAFSPLTKTQQKVIVDTCAQTLVTPFGLRSLSPQDSQFQGRYEGGPKQRDGSYHQGTVWGWLLGLFIRSHLKVYRKPEIAASYLEGLKSHMSEAGVGQLSEIFDGSAPQRPRGCYAQAWSSAETLYSWWLCEQSKVDTSKK